MRPIFEKLLSVQELDREIIQIRIHLAAGPERIRVAEEELAGHRERYEGAARRAKEAGRLAERKNADVDEADRKLKDIHLKRDTARTQKEYEAAKLEIAGLKADREIIEEEALQQWSVGEEREAEAAREKALVVGQEAALEETRSEWAEEEKERTSRLDVLSAEKSARLSGLPPTWLSVYERVIERVGVPALVPIVEQFCQGCQMNVSIHDVTRAWKGAEVVQCKACGRIMYAETL